jgi:hypothetical protein
MAKKDADKKDTAEKDAGRAGVKLGSKIANAPTATNTGGYELRTAPAKLESMKMAGHNNGGFELRAVQEQGTH